MPVIHSYRAEGYKHATLPTCPRAFYPLMHDIVTYSSYKAGPAPRPLSSFIYHPLVSGLATQYVASTKSI